MTEIDRDPLIDELRAALDAAPSAGFHGRVRESIAAARAPRWPWMTLVLAPVLVTLVVMLALSAWPPARQVRRQSQAASVGRIGEPQTSVAGVTLGTVARQPATRAPTQAPSASMRSEPLVRGPRVAASSDSNELLVPDDERLALRTLLTALEARAATVPPMTRPAEDLDGQLLIPLPISIPALTIEPLTPQIDRRVEEKH